MSLWSNGRKRLLLKLVPWHYVHPQTDHATFRPTPYGHPTFRPLWQFTTVHFDPITFYYCDRWTQWQFTTVTLRPLYILLLWQMDPVTIYYCDTSPPIRYIQVTNVTPPKSRMFCHCNRMSTFFYLDCDRTSTFVLKRNVDILSQVTRDHLEAFRLVSRGVDKRSQWSKSPCGKLLKVAAASNERSDRKNNRKTPKK
jgi:hypothetical protein